MIFYNYLHGHKGEGREIGETLCIRVAFHYLNVRTQVNYKFLLYHLLQAEEIIQTLTNDSTLSGDKEFRSQVRSFPSHDDIPTPVARKTLNQY